MGITVGILDMGACKEYCNSGGRNNVQYVYPTLTNNNLLNYFLKIFL